jgi:hypothetical protein
MLLTDPDIHVELSATISPITLRESPRSGIGQPDNR